MPTTDWAAQVWYGERATCPLPVQTKSGAMVRAETRAWSGTWNDEDCIFGVIRDVSFDRMA